MYKMTYNTKIHIWMNIERGSLPSKNYHAIKMTQ